MRANSTACIPFRPVRVALAVLLCITGALKAKQWFDGAPPTPWYTPCAIVFELGLAFWLASGLVVRAARIAVLIGFSVFALAAAGKALAGAATCGCFGNVGVNPWVTLSLDIAVLAAVARSHATVKSTRRALDVSAMVIVALVAMPLATSAALILGASRAAAVPCLRGTNRSIQVGDPLGLLPCVDIGDRLRSGRWMVMFYRYNCNMCVDELPRYIAAARLAAATPDGSRYAFISVPPHAPDEADLVPADTPCVRGHLSADAAPSVQTPLVVRLDDGVVSAVPMTAD